MNVPHAYLQTGPSPAFRRPCVMETLEAPNTH